jgi:hypothetical protein
VSKRDSFLLRLRPEVMEAMRRWAEDEFRSTNGQIEFVLARALEQAGRSKPIVPREMVDEALPKSTESKDLP